MFNSGAHYKRERSSDPASPAAWGDQGVLLIKEAIYLCKRCVQTGALELNFFFQGERGEGFWLLFCVEGRCGGEKVILTGCLLAREKMDLGCFDRGRRN